MENTTTPEVKMTGSDYLAQRVMYGGEIVTRGEMLADLQRIATTWTTDPERQRLMVDRFMQGADLA